MVKLTLEDDVLIIDYNGHRIANHCKETPFLLVGSGDEHIEFYRGNFEIDDNIRSKVPLENYEIVGDTITFSALDYSLEAKFVEEGGRLHIKLTNTGREANRYWINLFAEEDEKVYGCGEQASYFNLRGRNFPLWTSEPGVGRDKSSLTTFYANLRDRAGGDYYHTYYPEHTFVSTRKYWCHADVTCYADFDFKKDDFHNLYFWDMPNELVIGFADNYPDMLENLTDFTGRLPELPDWLHDGVILGVQGGTEQVKGYYDLAKSNGVKVSGVWCQDWAGINMTSFGKRLYWNWQWNKERYPGLEEMISDLEGQGTNFLAYICPFFLENERLYNMAHANDYLVLNKEGDPYIVDFGEFDCGIVDLTNEAAFNWYKSIIKFNLIELGIKGWMADFGEYLPVDCVLHNGVDAKLMHNEWPVLWARCNYEAVEESGKLGEVIYFMRAGGYGSQKYSLSLWAGDQSVNWETHDGIPSVIPASLSTGMIGNPYNHSDIGGYTSLHGNIRTKELFERWCEMNVFSAFMRTHECNRPEQNFQFYHDEFAMKHMGRMTDIRVALKPYIKAMVKDASEKGHPLQRPLFFHYEEDSEAYDIQTEYLFGRDILVSPVITPNTERQEVFLPKDTWVHFWTGDEYTGGHVTVPCPIGYPPVFYRKGSEFENTFIKVTGINRL